MAAGGPYVANPKLNGVQEVDGSNPSAPTIPSPYVRLRPFPLILR